MIKINDTGTIFCVFLSTMKIAKIWIQRKLEHHETRTFTVSLFIILVIFSIQNLKTVIILYRELPLFSNLRGIFEQISAWSR